MSDIKAIETQYKGYRFRSRLEARWAVYFDALGIEWEYEIEGFDLGVLGAYLPDFWLPQVKMWAEVKPCQFSRVELAKCEALHYGTGHACIFLDGSPLAQNYYTTMEYPSESTGGDYPDYVDVYVMSDYLDEGRFYTSTGYVPWTRATYSNNSVERAVALARSARFEHGEKPIVYAR